MMLELSQAPSPPPFGLVSACEDEGVLQALSFEQAVFCANSKLGNGCPVIITETAEHVRPALGTQDTQAAFSIKSSPPNSIALLYKEKGFVGCLKHLCNTEGNGWTKSLASVTLKVASSLQPYMDPMLDSGNQFTFNRTMSSWTQSSGTGSNIICISWHHVMLRLAAGYADDTVKIFSQKPLQPILKHKIQKNITQVQWLPYSMSVVCVCCDSGILMWSVDPASVVMRPSGACITLLPFTRPDNPCMAVHPLGSYLCSSSGKGMSVWDVPLVSEDSVQHGGNVSQLLYSPDATQLCVVMSKPSTLRVFKTSDWSFTEWICDSAITYAVWSPCSQYVVFSCMNPSTLYAISPDMSTNSALPLLSLTPTQIHDQENEEVVVGGQVKQLCWRGERLLVLFENSNYLLLLHTLTLCSLKLAHGGFIKGPDDAVVMTADFHQSKSQLLSVVWSDNSIQHIPLLYTSRQTLTNPMLANSFRAFSP